MKLEVDLLQNKPMTTKTQPIATVPETNSSPAENAKGKDHLSTIDFQG